jgi:hypothetical protein
LIAAFVRASSGLKPAAWRLASCKKHSAS